MQLRSSSANLCSIQSYHFRTRTVVKQWSVSLISRLTVYLFHAAPPIVMENLNQLSWAEGQLCYQALPAAYFPWVLIPLVFSCLTPGTVDLCRYYWRAAFLFLSFSYHMSGLFWTRLHDAIFSESCEQYKHYRYSLTLLCTQNCYQILKLTTVQLMQRLTVIFL